MDKDDCPKCGVYYGNIIYPKSVCYQKTFLWWKEKLIVRCGYCGYEKKVNPKDKKDA